MIEDFDDGNVSLFFGEDDLVYYSSACVDADEYDSDGWKLYRAHGGFGLRELFPPRKLWPAMTREDQMRNLIT